jgi:glycosyltransferase involved in cell wall biosynthesis
MRIAIYHNLPSGGAKRALYETGRRLARRHQVDVFTLSGADHEFCDLRSFALRYRTQEFHPLPLFGSPFGLLNHGVRAADIPRLRSVHSKIARQIDNGDYDAAFLHGDQYTQSPLLTQFLSVPTIYYCQDALRKVYDPLITRPYQTRNGVRAWVNRVNVLRRLYLNTVIRADRSNVRSATLVLVNSYFSRETIYRIYDIPPRVCYLGVDVDAFRPLAKEREPYVLSVGAVTPIKGFDFLIQSLALIPARLRPPLVIVGNYVDPDEGPYLEKLACGLGVKVRFHSLIEEAELVELYNRACITLYAPVLEPFGLVPLESMACGTPVVGVAEGGVRETIQHGDTGLLTDREPAQFAQAIQELLSNPLLADEMGRRGASHVQDHWSWDASVARLESHLESVARENSAQ